MLRLKIESLKDRIRNLNKFINYDITVIGSYNTLNVGDRILCDSIALFYKEKGYKVRIQSKRDLTNINSTYIIVCGGDILHDANENNWYFLKEITKINSKIIFIGAGSPGFFIKPKSEIEKLLGSINFISTRDLTSYKRLTEFKPKCVQQSVDNAFLMSKDLKFEKENVTTKTIILNIKAYESANNSLNWSKKKGNDKKKISLKDYIKFWNDTILYFKDKKYKVISLSMTLADEKFVKNNFSKKIHLIYDFTLDYFLVSKRIARAEIVFSSRYHFLILSLLNNKSIYCYAYADKVENLCEDLNIKYIRRNELGNINNFLLDEKNIVKPIEYESQIKVWCDSHWLKNNDVLNEE